MGLPMLQRLTLAKAEFSFWVEVVEAKGKLNFGLAGTNFKGSCVGRDDLSWGIDEHGWAWHRRVSRGRRKNLSDKFDF